MTSFTVGFPLSMSWPPLWPWEHVIVLSPFLDFIIGINHDPTLSPLEMDRGKELDEPFGHGLYVIDGHRPRLHFWKEGFDRNVFHVHLPIVDDGDFNSPRLVLYRDFKERYQAQHENKTAADTVHDERDAYHGQACVEIHDDEILGSPGEHEGQQCDKYDVPLSE